MQTSRVVEGNIDESDGRTRLIRDLKAASPSPVKNGSSKEFHNYTHARTNDLPNCTVRHLETSRHLELTEAASRVSIAGT